MVTCCGDQSVNSMIQSYNVYPPNFAVYLIGRTLLPQGQTINGMNHASSQMAPCQLVLILFILSSIFKRIQHY